LVQHQLAQALRNTVVLMWGPLSMCSRAVFDYWTTICSQAIFEEPTSSASAYVFEPASAWLLD
jgi:hypothetical protein